MRHVPHLYVPGPWRDGDLGLEPVQIAHLTKVLRLESGSAVTYTDGEGTVGSGVLRDRSVERGAESVLSAPKRRLVMAVAPPSNKDRARFLVEKLAEIGVDELVWVETRHTQGHPPPDQKAGSWAVSALEQSRGERLMQIRRGHLDQLPNPISVAEPSGPPLVSAPEMTILIGPEGGLDPTEVPDGAKPFSLGERILRIETAAVVAAGVARLL